VTGASRGGIHIVNDYPHPPEKVWRALTGPAKGVVTSAVAVP
jgi:uncharacterized protein YndB with AHSA1/START domain